MKQITGSLYGTHTRYTNFSDEKFPTFSKQIRHSASAAEDPGGGAKGPTSGSPNPSRIPYGPLNTVATIYNIVIFWTNLPLTPVVNTFPILEHFTNLFDVVAMAALIPKQNERVNGCWLNN